MSKEVKFKFFLNGKEIKQELIDWSRSCSVGIKNGNEAHVTYLSYLLDKDEPKSTCGMSTRHKACGQGYPQHSELISALGTRQNILTNNDDFSNAVWTNNIFKGFEEADRAFAIQKEIGKPATPYQRTSSADELKTQSGIKESDGKLSYELDWGFLTQMAERMATNKDKYPPYNWKKPMDVEKLKQATFRHMLEIMNGNYEDEGRLQGHLEALALNAMMINYQLKNKK